MPSSPREPHLEPTAGASSPPAKRLTLSEITAALLEAHTRARAVGSSVTLTRNAKGNTQIEVVVRSGESELVQTAEDAEREAKEIYDRLRTAYPLLEDAASS